LLQDSRWNLPTTHFLPLEELILFEIEPLLETLKLIRCLIAGLQVVLLSIDFMVVKLKEAAKTVLDLLGLCGHDVPPLHQ
jgi:hypothetical protein